MKPHKRISKKGGMGQPIYQTSNCVKAPLRGGENQKMHQLLHGGVEVGRISAGV